MTTLTRSTDLWRTHIKSTLAFHIKLNSPGGLKRLQSNSKINNNNLEKRRFVRIIIRTRIFLSQECFCVLGCHSSCEPARPGCCQLDQLENLFITDQTWSFLIKLDHTWSYLIMLDHTWSNLIILDQTWSNLIKLDHTWSYLIMLDHSWSNLIMTWT